MSLFKATVIWTLGRYTFNDPQNTIDINSEQVNAFSPVNAWLVRVIIPGTNQIQYGLTFAPTSADLADSNTIQGVYVEQAGKGVLIDCISVDNFNLVANGTLSALVLRYGTPPAFSGPTATPYCITRSDDGSGSAHNAVVMDYVGQYFGNVRLKSNVSGVSIYLVYSYSTIKAVGNDSVAQC